jgi:DNA polymerase V
MNSTVGKGNKIMSPLFALVDCNNFYVSCERVFNPGLCGRPVIVLSNNDGCAVARSEEAKALGIGMGVPAFEIKDLIRRHRVTVLSSNYALYGDMSRRVMQVLSGFSPELEVYSIDEAFLDLSGLSRRDLAACGREMQERVRRWTGIPVAIGIAETKTLAKIAARLAKKSPKAAGVLDLSNSPWRDRALAAVAVGDVWGVGRRYAKFLLSRGINTALDLRRANEAMIRRRMGIVGVRLLKELNGISCYPLEVSPPMRKSVGVSRTFKRELADPADLREAISTYAAAAAEKLRAEKLVAGTLTVYLLTSRFREDYYYNSASFRLPVATSHTPELIACAREGFARIFKPQRGYKKAGVLLNEIGPESPVQASFFDHVDRPRARRLMQALDRVNREMGAATLVFGAQGVGGRKAWKTTFSRRSPAYTTRWDQLPVVS